MNDFIYPYDLNINLANIQINLANQVIKENTDENKDNVVGVDVSFSSHNKAVAAAVLVDLNNLEIMEKVTRKVDLFFPYIPGFLGFRESNAMVSVLKDLKSGFDVIMVNGHGILHPRGFGLASQVGLLMDMPSIGWAKRLTAGRHKEGDKIFYNETSPVQPIILREEIVGAYLNKHYVSIGHKITLKTAIELVKKSSIYKTPEPLRQAHFLATNTFNKMIKN